MRIDNDPNLTDGARRCARKLAELTYSQNREGRALPVTVTYLAPLSPNGVTLSPSA